MRPQTYLASRYRAIVSYLGLVLFMGAMIMLSPLLVLFWWPDELTHVRAFLLPAGVMGVTGLLLWRVLRLRHEATLSLQEGGVIVMLSWLFVCLFSAWPFTLGLGLTFRQALFESVSGWTTTGLSVVDVTQTPRVFLLWRSLMQLVGGAGLAIVMLSSIIGSTGAALSAAEGRDQLLPQIRRSAILVLVIYSSYVLVGVVALRVAGMNWFDAVNHAFCALSTGGFSTRPESIGYWDAVAVEAVTLALMVLGNLSFLTAWVMMRGRFRAVFRNGELRLFVFLVALGSATVFLLSTAELYQTLAKRVRVAVFEVVSALTTTGYSTVGYNDWNGFGVFVLIVLMFVGGGTSSTAGGLKQFRVYVLLKSAAEELKRMLLPRTAIVETPLWVGEHPRFLEDSTVRRVSAFTFIYICVFVIGVAIMTGSGYSLQDSIFEYASTVGTVGLSVGVTSASAPAAVHWAQIVGMFLGRLEFFVVLSGLTKLGRDAWEVLRVHRQQK